MAKGRRALFRVYWGANGAAAYRLDRQLVARLQRAAAELKVCGRVFGDRTAAGSKAEQAAAGLEAFLRAAGLGVSPGAAADSVIDGKARAAGEGRPG